MHANVQVRFGKGRLEKGIRRCTSLAAYFTESRAASRENCNPGLGNRPLYLKTWQHLDHAPKGASALCCSSAPCCRGSLKRRLVRRSASFREPSP
jgi:hypothetical protein